MVLHSPILRQALTFLLCLTASTARAEDWIPSELLLNIIRQIESANGRQVVGDQGRSLGAYQLSKAAWADVSAWRHSRNLETCDYETGVWCEDVSRSYAADYLRLIGTRLASRLHRSPTSGEVYAAYNMGLSAFARCQYSLGRVNSMTASKCCRIDALVPPEPMAPEVVTPTYLAWQTPQNRLIP